MRSGNGTCNFAAPVILVIRKSLKRNFNVLRSTDPGPGSAGNNFRILQGEHCLLLLLEPAQPSRGKKIRFRTTSRNDVNTLALSLRKILGTIFGPVKEKLCVEDRHQSGVDESVQRTRYYTRNQKRKIRMFRTCGNNLLLNQLYNPGWVLACSTIFFQASLSSIRVFQYVEIMPEKITVKKVFKNTPEENSQEREVRRRCKYFQENGC